MTVFKVKLVGGEGSGSYAYEQEVEVVASNAEDAMRMAEQQAAENLGDVDWRAEDVSVSDYEGGVPFFNDQGGW